MPVSGGTWRDSNGHTQATKTPAEPKLSVSLMAQTPFLCTDPSCPGNANPLTREVAEALALVCPVCKEPLEESTGELDEFERRVIETFPHFIAYPFRALHQEQNIFEKTLSLVDVFTNTLKYMALIVESEYLRSDLKGDEELNEIISQDLCRPLVSSWRKFLLIAVPKMTEAGHKFFIPELPEFWNKIEKKNINIPGKGYYEEDGDFVETKSKLTLFQALVSYRNKFAHRAKQQEGAALKEFLFYYEKALRPIMEQMEWMVEYPMIKREGRAYFEMMGADIRKIKAIDAPKGLKETLVVHAKERDESLALAPFFIVPNEYLTDTGANEDLLIYDQSTGKRLCYVSPRGHHRETDKALLEWRKLVESKRIVAPLLSVNEINPEALRDRILRATVETQKGLEESKKIISDTHCSRKAGASLDLFPESSSALCAVTAPAGMGKTCFVNELAGNWMERELPVLFLRAAQLEDSDLFVEMKARLRVDPCVDLQSFLGHCGTEEKPLVVILDGVQSHAGREELLRSVLRIGRASSGTPKLRVMISLRPGGSDWISVDPEEAERLFFPPEQGENRNVGGIPATTLPPLSHREIEAMWLGYSKAGNDRFAPKFDFQQLQNRSRRVLALLSNPQILQIFLRTFSGEKLPKEMDRRGIFEAFFTKLAKRSGDKGRFLRQLAEISWETSSPRFDYDDLIQDERTSEDLQRTDIACPYHRLTRLEGVISEEATEGGRQVVFSADLLLEHVLGQYLVESGRADTAKELLEVFEKNAAHPLLIGAIQSALSAKLSTEGNEFLWEFIEEGTPRAATCAGEFLGKLLREEEDLDAVTEGLLQLPSVNDLHAGLAASALLEDELAFDIRRNFLEKLATRVDDIGLPASEVLGDLYGAVSAATYDLGDYNTCRRWSQRALDVRRECLGDNHPSVATSWNNLGNLHRKMGDLESAGPCYLQALELFKNLYGEKHPSIATLNGNLGTLFRKRGKMEEARTYCEKALEIRKGLHGEEHPATAACLNSLAALHADLGEFDAAKKRYERALTIRQGILGSHHPDVAASHNNLGLVERRCGNNEAAQSHYEKSLAIFRKLWGSSHPTIASSLNNLGGLHASSGNIEEARASYEEALGIFLEVYGEDHPHVATSCSNLGNLLADTEDVLLAKDFHERALQVRRRSFGDNHPQTASSWHSLGGVCARIGEEEKARKCYSKALRIRREHFEEKHPQVAAGFSSLGLLERKLGNLEDARECFIRALEIFREIYGEVHAHVATAHYNLAGLFHKTGEGEEALQHLESALSVRRKLLGEEHKLVGRTWKSISRVHKSMGNLEKAAECKGISASILGA